MAHPRRRFGPVVVLFAAMLVFAVACAGTTDGDQSADQGVASLSDGTGDSAPTGGSDGGDGDDGLEAPANPEDAFALFEECMADAGFDFGAGVVVAGGSSDASGAIEVQEGDSGAQGEIDPQAVEGSFEDFDFEAIEEANKACEGHLANIDAGFDLTPEQQAAFEDAHLEWADCMREQGIEVPELQSGSSGIVIGGTVSDPVEIDPQSGQPSFDDLDFDFAAFDEAAETCQSVYEQFDELDGVFGDGSGQ